MKPGCHCAACHKDAKDYGTPLPYKRGCELCESLRRDQEKEAAARKREEAKRARKETPQAQRYCWPCPFKNECDPDFICQDCIRLYHNAKAYPEEMLAMKPKKPPPERLGFWEGIGNIVIWGFVGAVCCLAVFGGTALFKKWEEREEPPKKGIIETPDPAPPPEKAKQ